MELELRKKEGDFVISFKSFLGEVIFKYLMSDKRMTLTTKSLGGVNYRVFVNDSNEVVSGKNDLVVFSINPGDYIKLNKI